MSDRILPLLIQPQVLFPGTTLPVRIAHPRQRRLVADAVKADKVVATIAMPSHFSGEEPKPRVGHVGCVARIVSAKKIPNRQIRIVLEGMDRFSIREVITTGEAYQRVVAAPYVDFEESAALLVTFADEVRQYYVRYVRASGKIADAGADEIAQLPTDPAELSMHLPSLLNLDDESSQRFLASRSTLMRLRELSALLAPAASTAEASADIHARSRSNGHGAKRH